MPLTLLSSAAYARTEERNAYNGGMSDVFAKRLREIRLERKLNQPQVAAVCRDARTGKPVTREAVSQWEKGATRPGLDHIAPIARLLKVSADYLLGLTDQEMGIYGVSDEARKLAELWDTLSPQSRQTTLHSLNWAVQQEKNGRRNALESIIEMVKQAKKEE